MEISYPSGLKEIQAVKSWARLHSPLPRAETWFLFLACLLLVALIGWIDWRVGWEISLFIFYALPIALASWYLGGVFGMVIAVLCSVAWWIAQASGNPYETDYGLALAFLNCVFYFGIVSLATVAVRKREASDLARIRVLEERRQLERDIVAVSEHEHQRIGRDLHDGLCQQLAAIGWAAQALAEDLRERGDPAAPDADLIGVSIQKAVTEARELAHGILPVHVDRQGLAVALGHLAATMSALTGAAITLEEGSNFRLDDPGKAMHLYRIAQEAVANALRHGGARRIGIHLNSQGGVLEMRIDDYGTGLDPVAFAEGNGMGLRTMQYRAQALGDCHFSISQRADGGTSVRCALQTPH